MSLHTTIFVRHLHAQAKRMSLEEMAQHYQLEIKTSDQFPIRGHHGVIDAKPAGGTLTRYVRIFSVEFGLYPREFVEKTKLKRIVLCEDLAFNGQPRNAVPDFEHDTLYLEIKRGIDAVDYMRKVIHHDFFHIVDWRDDALVYRDDAWSKLNRPDFRYGNGGINAQDNPLTSVLSNKYPGFLNHYSTTGVEEDKAELFANLVVNRRRVDNMADKDEILTKKIEFLKQMLVAFSPTIDEEFWNEVSKSRR